MNSSVQPNPFNDLAPLQLVTAYGGQCDLNWHAGQFSEVKVADLKPELPVLLCFGRDFSWPLLSTLAQAIALPSGGYTLSLSKPHPALPAALRLHLPLTYQPTPALLSRLALDHDCQLVYLAQQPTLRMCRINQIPSTASASCSNVITLEEGLADKLWCCIFLNDNTGSPE